MLVSSDKALVVVPISKDFPTGLPPEIVYSSVCSPFKTTPKDVVLLAVGVSAPTLVTINDEINTEIQISTQKNQNRLEAEIKANQEVLDRIALAQAELLQVAIDAWRAEELAKIQANPSAYIRTNMSEAEQSEATEATEVTEA